MRISNAEYWFSLPFDHFELGGAPRYPQELLAPPEDRSTLSIVAVFEVRLRRRGSAAWFDSFSGSTEFGHSAWQSICEFCDFILDDRLRHPHPHQRFHIKPTLARGTAWQRRD